LYSQSNRQLIKDSSDYQFCDTDHGLVLVGGQEPEDRTMDAKNIGNSGQRLFSEYQNLVQAINRNRLATKELAVENTEDESDLATISQNRELLYDLHESDFQRLRSIQEALKTIDSGQYGECVNCGEDIKEKRLMAVPWTTLCIRCQEEKETEHTSSRLVLAGMDEPETEP
jgi:DnaK suppressor protein